ncbi:ELKS/Rab6-interacting/CAST family member 1-like isoform X1, partial [Lates japonicus]
TEKKGAPQRAPERDECIWNKYHFITRVYKRHVLAGRPSRPGDEIERDERDGNKDRLESSMETVSHKHLYKCVQEALLAAISEKDANIALLELSSSKKKKTQEEVAALKREKDSLVQQLKQQV